jgi:hypothetical protein
VTTKRSQVQVLCGSLAVICSEHTCSLADSLWGRLWLRHDDRRRKYAADDRLRSAHIIGDFDIVAEAEAITAEAAQSELALA